MKILIMRGGALGDFLLTLPGLMDLRRQYPHARLELRTRPRYAFLALDTGLANQVADIDAACMAEPYAPAMTDMARDYFAGFDLVISYLGDQDGSMARNLHAAGVKNVLYMPTRPASGEHASDAWRPRWPAAAGNVPAPHPVPRLKLPEKTLLAGRQRLHAVNAGKPAAILHPGSGSQRKNWPRPHFLALARYLHYECGLTPVFLLGEAESHWPPDALKPWPAISQSELPEVAGMLDACDLYVGNDSGITHLAAILGRPTVALFGPTDPESWAPRGARVTVIRAPAPHHAMPDLEISHVQNTTRATVNRKQVPHF